MSRFGFGTASQLRLTGRRMVAALSMVTAVAIPGVLFADGPQDNIPDNVRQVPPVGIEVPEADRQQLEQGLTQLNQHIDSLRKRKDARTALLLPDVEIFARAVRDGLEHRELFSPGDVKNAHQVLGEGLARAGQLLNGQASWLTQKGLVVRGYRSRIDQTVQPYGLVIPESYDFDGRAKYRLDLWFHGRGERTSESAFISGRMKSVGQIAPQDTIVLHPYGRYSNAFKFAGEIDVLEALKHAQHNYRVDDDRVAVRGFSMGGAGCWQMAVHYPDMFFAATPGAGFSETPEFLKSFQQETLSPTWYEQKLWQMYDCTGYAMNLTNLPTIAYSGELDIQKQAADIMESTLAAQGVRLTHLIGPDTKHAIHKDSLIEIERRLSHLAERGRAKLPREVRFVTYTLKYNRSFWVTVTGLGEHWKKASVHARINQRKSAIEIVDVENVTGLSFNIASGRSPFDLLTPVTIEINGQSITTTPTETDASWSADLHLDGTEWKTGLDASEGLSKRRDLQGPIDDAFMDSFIVVRPTGKASSPAVEQWAASELEHTVKEWRRHFRGDAVVKNDSDITDADVASSNLILFGDPSSNSVLKGIAGGLPIGWSERAVTVGHQQFDADHHAPVMIYPNPQNPSRYVVLNSGFTYREFAYLNNARQVPKLPDWAVIDVRTPASSLWPGKVVAADFFDEQWQLKQAE